MAVVVVVAVVMVQLLLLLPLTMLLPLLLTLLLLLLLQGDISSQSEPGRYLTAVQALCSRYYSLAAAAASSVTILLPQTIHLLMHLARQPGLQRLGPTA